MKKIAIFISIIMIYTLASCQSGNNGSYNNADVSSFSNLTKEDNVILLDVRTPDEFSNGHIKNALNINVNDSNFESEIAKLDKSKKILVYCMSGGRSSNASNILIQNGFKEVYNLDGGILSWRASNLPEEKGNISTKSDQNTSLTLEAYKQKVNSDKIVLVDFYAAWCGPCKKLSPIVDKIAKENPDKIELIKINVDKNQELAKSLNITSIPYIEVYKKGKLDWSQLGLMTEKEILKKLKLD